MVNAVYAIVREILPMKYFTIDVLDYNRDQSILCCLERISDSDAWHFISLCLGVEDMETMATTVVKFK